MSSKTGCPKKVSEFQIEVSLEIFGLENQRSDQHQASERFTFENSKARSVTQNFGLGILRSLASG